LTLNQNLLLPDIPFAEIDTLRAAPICQEFFPNPGPFSRGVVTCTGSEFCSYGIIETKSRAIRWARQLDEWAKTELNDPPAVVRLHMSGCSASCAQPQIADIGLRGETHRSERGGNTEAVDVGVGGDLGRETFIEWIESEVPIEAIPIGVKRLLRAYEQSTTDQSFTDWLDETDTQQVHELVVPEQEVA
jgi:ferredoxin-nitrite reductase